jgi:multisubunit Na+/H+ antiporter MnhC subunit
MFLAEEAAKASNFNGFDVFVILFTIIIAIGVIRLLMARKKNAFAIGFGLVSLAVFLFMDIVMVMHWLDKI